MPQTPDQVSLRDAGEVDTEIVRLLRVAYEQNGWPRITAGRVK